MPVVSVNKKRLEKLIGEDIDEVLEKIPMIGADIERDKGNEVDIEFFPNRPDLFSAEGIARAMKGYLGKETGLVNYSVKSSNTELIVKESVKGVRPKIVGAVVKGLDLSEDDLASIVNLQEHLHWGLGRDRKKVSIGLHDLEKIKPPFTYKAVNPEEISFVPLDHSEEMNLSEILKKHKKGKEFGSIIKNKNKYLVIVDEKNDVLSFPPIINGVLTEVTESTNEVFIDVTGTERRGTEKALNIIVTALEEIGGEIFSVEKKGIKEEKTPNLSPRTKKINLKKINDLIGLNLNKEEAIGSLEKMRFGASSKDKKIEVNTPSYRSDILHKWDIIEDVAIGYGYDNIEPEIPNVQGIGETHEVEELGQNLREIMTGLGYLEVMTLTLTNKENEFKRVNRDKEEVVTIQNPISEEHTIFRKSLLPSLLNILEINKHRNLPQKIFEYGEVQELTEEFTEENYYLSAISLSSETGFSEAKSLVQSIFNEINKEYKLKESDDGLFLKGRRGDLFVDGEKVGVFGEINPEVIKEHELEHPCIGLEIKAQKLI